MKLLLYTAPVVLLVLATPAMLSAQQQCPYQRALYQQYQQHTITQLTLQQQRPQVNLQMQYQQQVNPGIASRTTYLTHSHNVTQQVHTPGTWNVNTSVNVQHHTSQVTTHQPVMHLTLTETHTALTTHHLQTIHNVNTSYGHTHEYNVVNHAHVGGMHHEPLHFGLLEHTTTNHQYLTQHSTLSHLSLTQHTTTGHVNVTHSTGQVTHTQNHTTATVHTSVTHTPGRLTTNTHTVTTHEAHTTPGHGPTVTNQQIVTKTVTPVPPKLELQKKTVTTMTTRMDSSCGHCHHPNTQGGTTPLPLVSRPVVPAPQMVRQPGTTPLIFALRQPTLPGIVPQTTVPGILPQLAYQGQQWPGQMAIGPGLSQPGVGLVPNQGIVMPGSVMSNGGTTSSLPGRVTLAETPSLFEGKSVWPGPATTAVSTSADMPSLTLPPPLLRVGERPTQSKDISTAVTPEEEATLDQPEALLPPPDLSRLTEAIWEPVDPLDRVPDDSEVTTDDSEETFHLEPPVMGALPR
jgi:hypothetical protein